MGVQQTVFGSPVAVHMSTASTDVQVGKAEAPTPGFIELALRSAAMKLHTREQAPREGQAASNPRAEPFVPTIKDYLKFLVDSKHVYEAFEEAVQCEKYPELAALRDTGLERTIPLETDIQQLVKEFGIDRPPVGEKGREYANEIRELIVGEKGSVPEFICHYYNFYFAHTAGGRMIGKKMSALLLNNRTLDFYKWDGDLTQLKSRVKSSIEEIASNWSEAEKNECVEATADAFRGGGGVNAYLMGDDDAH